VSGAVGGVNVAVYTVVLVALKLDIKQLKLLSPIRQIV
jgi:hypothetical protein